MAGRSEIIDSFAKSVLLIYTLITRLSPVQIHSVVCISSPNQPVSTGKSARHRFKLTGFAAAVHKHFKQGILLNGRNAWEAKFKTSAVRVAELTTQIKRAERDIDQVVYRLFDLTPDEIALIEAAVK